MKYEFVKFVGPKLIDADRTGEKRLLFEVLNLGVTDALKFLGGNRNSKVLVKHYRDGFIWIESNETHNWSFHWVCHQIGSGRELMIAIRKMIYKAEQEGRTQQLCSDLLERGSVSTGWKK